MNMDVTLPKGIPFSMPVELGKIREFARATKSRNTDYDGPSALTPPTFLMTATFWSTPGSDPTMALTRDRSHVLHGEQEFVFHGAPPRAGDVLTVTRRIDRVYEKTGARGGVMQFVEIVTEFADGTGRLVAEARSITIETSKAAKH
jgi:N-terminal half of MaoC dehydratase